ncbi:hypothetical protein BC936DRAFT_147806 [Jimgerdemannia flammicorona]|uniref:UBC core domain-containing protein n=1 Tax=Jimgerdemannia flammicorona TaxID=994334 RepID=A0A433D4E6_9FUNG|nr:hypothetical protein BC936DRAFT_147806 [Jimgerdemannia flammicorona]
MRLWGGVCGRPLPQTLSLSIIDHIHAQYLPAFPDATLKPNDGHSIPPTAEGVARPLREPGYLGASPRGRRRPAELEGAPPWGYGHRLRSTSVLPDSPAHHQVRHHNLPPQRALQGKSYGYALKLSVRSAAGMVYGNISCTKLQQSGEICLDILKTTWSPAWTLQSTLLAISLLLVHPEPSSPLNCDAANLLRCGDIDGYNSLVRMYTELYAMDHVSSDEEGCIEEEGMLESAVLVEQQESSFAGVDGHSGMVSVG